MASSASDRPLRIAVVAGEPSGDRLAASVIGALRSRCRRLEVEGVGGPCMEEQGLRSLIPMERLSVMGLVDPLKRLPELLRIRRSLFNRFTDTPPDLFLGIDSPEFNLPLERRLRRRKIRTAHLVSPSVWAWRRGRLHSIERSVDLMLCLFPFETDLYRQQGIPVQFVGHPMADEITRHGDSGAARSRLGLAPPGQLVALLPGSRASEVGALAPLFLQVADSLWRANPQLSFVMPAATAELEQALCRHLQACPELPLQLLRGQAREAMAAADAALLASGTAALEAALLKCPAVVAYRMGGVSWQVLSRLVKTPWVALPNILAGRELMPEFLQAQATPDALEAALDTLLSGGSAVSEMLEAFDTMHVSLRQDCAAQAAQSLLRLASGECMA